MFWKTVIIAFLVVGISADDLEEHCRKNGTEGDFRPIYNRLQNCLDDMVDFDLFKITNDTKLFEPRNTLMRRLCAKSTQIKTCIRTVFMHAIPCGTNMYVELDTATNRTNDFIDFVCYNNAERFIQFNNAHGVECLLEKADNMFGCYIAMIKVVLKVGNNMTLEEKCVKYDEMVSCATEALKSHPTIFCASSTPSEIIQSFITFMRRREPCATTPPKN